MGSLVDVIRLRVTKTEQIEVVTAGTPVHPSSDTQAEAVRVTNNNASKLVTVGATDAGSDASVTPKVGTVLQELDSIIMYMAEGGNKDAADQCSIDADTNSTFVTVEHLGR